MRQPLVSTCTPTYNHVNFVGEALSSAIEQNYDNLEVIVADDGSTDGTFDVIRQYEQIYPGRLVVLPSRRNRGLEGIVENYNRALRACRGEYIAFLEGDDLYLPGKIARQVEWMEEDERRVLCGHDVEAFDSGTGEILYRWSERFGLRAGEGARAVIRHNVPFGTVSVMVRASALPQQGFDERLRAVLDWKLWIDCLAAGGLYGYVPGVYARYRRHAGNITNHYANVRQDDQFLTLALVESRYPHLAASSRYGRATLFYSLGVAALLQRRRTEARMHLVNSVRQGTRFRWKAALQLLLTWLPDRGLAALGR